MNNHDKSFTPRKSSRLKELDYSLPGSYFLTICTHEKKCLFGNISDGRMNLNHLGKIVKACWEDIPLHHPDISNDIFIVMPNHIHGIISINALKREGHRPSPTGPGSPETRPHLFEIVRAFKTFSALKINKVRNSKGTPLWQRGYYDRVIRNEAEYKQIGEYIVFNPLKWDTDEENQS